jgi:chromosome segregation ATPase
MLECMHQLKESTAAPKEDHVVPAHAVQEQVREHLSQIKSDIIGWQSLQQQLMGLREERAASTEQLKGREQQISELAKRLELAQRDKDTLQTSNTQLLEQMRSQAASAETKIQRYEARQGELDAEITKLHASLSAKEKEIEVLQKACDDGKTKVCK